MGHTFCLLVAIDKHLRLSNVNKGRHNGQLEKQGTGNGTGTGTETGTGTGICAKSCTGRDEMIACTDLVHKHFRG